MRHDPPRIVYAGRVWHGTMEVLMPTFTPLPAGFHVHAYRDEQGRVAVSVAVDGVEVSRYAFSQTTDEMRAERERHAEKGGVLAWARRPDGSRVPFIVAGEEDGG